MKKLGKIIVVSAGTTVLVLAALVFIVPHVVDIQKYKSVVEKKVSAAAGLPVTLGPDIELKLFPAVALSFTDLRVGNPEGFTGSDLLIIDSFKTELKVVPLLSKKVEIDRFLVDGLEIHLERSAEGIANWQRLVGPDGKKKDEKVKSNEPSSTGGFQLTSLDIGEFLVSNGRITLNDHFNGVKKEISDLNIGLVDVNLDRPVTADIRVSIDGTPFSLIGQVGPVGRDPGKGRLAFDLHLGIAEQLQLGLSGSLIDATADPKYDLLLDAAPFSPRGLASALGFSLPEGVAEDVLNSAEVLLSMNGSTQNVTIEKGAVKVDDSTLSFEGKASSLTPINLEFQAHLDMFDMDRYFPASEKVADKGAESGESPEDSPRDYSRMQDMTLALAFTADELKARGGTLQQVKVELRAKEGVFHVEPMSAVLYGGVARTTVTLDVRDDVPKTDVKIKIADVQVGPLLHDFAKKDILEGLMEVDAELSLKGDSPSAVKSSLSGVGDIRFQDGAIVGIDLAGMVRNVQSSFGLADDTGGRPKTDFAELRVPFTLTKGLFNTPSSSLKSPFIRVNASGDANLVTEVLDMRVQPKFVGTMVGQGDDQLRTGLMVPVVIGGTFSSPEFSPDLEEMAKSKIVEEGMKKLLGEETETESALPVKEIETIKEGLKKFLPF